LLAIFRHSDDPLHGAFTLAPRQSIGFGLLLGDASFLWRSPFRQDIPFTRPDGICSARPELIDTWVPELRAEFARQ
jgi:hypothetical protein